MVTKQKLTLEEFLGLPEDDVSLEYVDGEVIEKVSPTTKHSALQRGVVKQLELPCRQAGFEAFPELRFIFGEPSRAYVPDIGIASRESIGVDQRGQWNDDLYFAPTVALEILSPGQNAGRLLEKLLFYMENGVKLAIVIDPQNELATVYEPGHEPRGVHVPGSIDLSKVIPGASLDLGRLFASLTP